MHYDYILIRYGELALKGKNQKEFLQKLNRNIKEHIKADVGENPRIEREQGRLLLYLDGAEPSKYYNALNHVFGISSYSPVLRTSLKMEDILEGALSEFKQAMGERKEVTFRITARRANKLFPLSSMDLATEVAQYVSDHIEGLTVDLKHADIDLKVEIRDEFAYITTQKFPGLGGLPLGSGGKGMLLLSGGIDSPVAAWCMAKRGLELTPVHFASPPYTSERAEQKVKDLLKKVSAYAGRMFMFTVPFAKVQEAILQNCPEEYFTIIMRRFMMRVAERIAVKEKCGALITGESLGQVASQTLQAIACTDAAAGMPVFRPLIGMDKSEIVKIARDIDTFEISIQPFEDCCTVFTPRHPRTKPELQAVLDAEAALDAEALIQECVDNASITRIAP